VSISPIHVGLIGFGFAGSTFHAPIIDSVEDLHLAAILQRNGETAAQAYPEARVVRSSPRCWPSTPSL